MEKSYIVEVLRTLRTEEQRDFGRWLASPFFNTRQDVGDLYDYLCKGNHLWDAKYLDKGRVFKKMFRGEEYNDAKLRQTVHFLGKQLEAFLAYQQVADEKFALDLAYLKSLRKRKLSKVFQKKINALNRAGLENEAQDSKGLRNVFVMYDELYSLMLGLNKAKAQHLQQSVDMFDRQFIADKLKYACLELSHNKVFKTDYQSKFLDSVLASIQADQSLLEYPAIAAYYYGYRIQTDPATAAEAYFDLRATLEKDREVFSQEELKDIYSMALNYCVGRMNQGDEVFLRESFTLFMDGISQGLLIQNGKLSTIAYLNTVSIGLRLKEYEAVKNFIQDYSKYLSKEDREGTEEYSIAKLYFEQKDYANAMSVLATFETKHILINLNAKSMMLKIFYELEEYDALESFLESFRAYLTRKEIISYHRPIYGNLVKYTRRLLRLNTYDKKQVDKLRQEIETANPLPERPWLLAQLAKL